MRYPPEHKQLTRTRVLRSAASALRRSGPEKVAVADVMRDAGLTHGGFYAHFDSKDDLLARAIESMFDEVMERFDEGAQGKQPREFMHAYVNRYLTLGHCDNREGGCPIAALATDIPRMDPHARSAFETGCARLASAIAAKMRELGVGNAGAAATSFLSEMVGALLLARCASDAATSEKLLAASRSQLVKRFEL